MLHHANGCKKRSRSQDPTGVAFENLFGCTFASIPKASPCLDYETKGSRTCLSITDMIQSSMLELNHL